MALTTLAAVKTHLGITDTNEDAALIQWIGGASAAIRRHVDDYLYGAIGGINPSNPAVVNCPGHALETGMTVTISGSDSLPSIDGTHVVTAVDSDTFSVPVDVTAAGTTGAFCRTYTEFYNGNGTNELLLTHAPVQAIISVNLDPAGYFGEPSGSFSAETLLTPGEDYALWRDNQTESEVSLRGLLVRINGALWPRPLAQSAGLLTLSAANPHGNIRVMYVAGYLRLLPEAMLAANQLVAQLRKAAVDGGPLGMEQYDYYRYQQIDPDKAILLLGTVSHLLKRFKRWTW